METNLYYYKAYVVSVYDGDTITVNLDLGLGITRIKEKIRLYGINTPEIRGGTAESKAKGIEARDFLRRRILNKTVIIQTHKDKSGKYGRLLGVVWKGSVNMNQRLIEKGHAVEYLL